jgi:hypothetical protein
MSTADNESAYREIVQGLISNGQLSADAREVLEIDRADLRLSPDQARAIEQEILASVESVQSPPPASSGSTPVAAQPSPNKTPELSAEQTSEPPANADGTDHSPSAQPFEVESAAAETSEASSFDFDPAMQTTMPPDLSQSPEYLAHIEEYERIVEKIVREKGIGAIYENGRAPELNQLIEQNRLATKDASEAEERVIARLTSSPPKQATPQLSEFPEANALSIQADLPPIFDPQDQQLLKRLESFLRPGGTRNLREADLITAQLLQNVISPSQIWINADTLGKFAAEPGLTSTQLIQEINRLWHEHSNSRWGFSRQLGIYLENGSLAEHPESLEEERRQTLTFSKTVGWWINWLEFFKPYAYLDFSDTAPAGHLPAFWFWQLPPNKPFSLGNLSLFADRGGCRNDADTLPAFMRMLIRCGIAAEAGATGENNSPVAERETATRQERSMRRQRRTAMPSRKRKFL